MSVGCGRGLSARQRASLMVCLDGTGCSLEHTDSLTCFTTARSTPISLLTMWRSGVVRANSAVIHPTLNRSHSRRIRDASTKALFGSTGSHVSTGTLRSLEPGCVEGVRCKRYEGRKRRGPTTIDACPRGYAENSASGHVLDCSPLKTKDPSRRPRRKACLVSDGVVAGGEKPYPLTYRRLEWPANE